MNKIKKILLILISAITMSCQFNSPSTLPSMFTAQFSSYNSLSTGDIEEDDCIWENTYNQFLVGNISNISILKEGTLKLAKDKDNKYFLNGEYISTIKKARFPFNAFKIGLQILQPAGTQLSVFIRTKGNDSIWSNWLLMKNEQEIILKKNALYVQYKIELKTINNNMTPSLNAISINYTSVPVKMLNLNNIKQTIKVNIPKPNIVSREEWGALPPKEEYTPHTPQILVIHHTWKPTVPDYKGAATIRGIQKYHMYDPKTGWNDIGYHYLIGPEGLLYAGRPETALGAHTVPNTNKVGISVIGNYDPDSDTLSNESYNILLDILTYLAAQYSISPDNIYGHRDFNPKTCPGDGIYLKLPEIKQEVKRRLEQSG